MNSSLVRYEIGGDSLAATAQHGIAADDNRKMIACRKSMAHNIVLILHSIEPLSSQSQIYQLVQNAAALASKGHSFSS